MHLPFNFEQLEVFDLDSLLNSAAALFWPSCASHTTGSSAAGTPTPQLRLSQTQRLTAPSSLNSASIAASILNFQSTEGCFSSQDRRLH